MVGQSQRDEFRLTGTVLFSFRSVLTFRAQAVLLIYFFMYRLIAF